MSQRVFLLPLVGGRKALGLAVALCLTGTTGISHAADNVNFDVLSGSPASAASGLHSGTKSERGLVVKRLNTRLGLPTFQQAPSTLAKRSGPLYLVKDVAALARQYLADLAPTYKMQQQEVDGLELVDVQRLGNGAAIVRFDNRVDGVAVFRERVGVLINADGSLRSVGGSMSGSLGVAGKASKQYRLSANDALKRMMKDMGLNADVAASPDATGREKGDYTEYGLASSAGDHFFLEPARVRPVMFRTEAGLLAAYYGELQVARHDGGPTRAWSYVIDASYGKLLFRKDLTEQDTAFSYRVYGEDSATFQPFVGPQGRDGFPHPTGLPDGYQPASFTPANLVTLVSSPFSWGDPWLPDAASETLGNNVDAFANLVAPDGYQPFDGDLRATLTAFNTFDYSYDHNQGPLASTTQSQAAVTNLFFLNNWLHDWFYDAGFDEASGNAQDSNFGRGGLEDDSIKAQAQDYAGLNNANMATPSDGGRPRMRMYVFTGNGPSQVELTGGVADAFATGTASFGAQVFDVTAELVQVDDADPSGVGGTTTDACQPLVNAAAVSGKIGFVDRGACSFVIKAANVQAAGGVGMLLADNVPGALTGMGGTDAGITIPSLRITFDDGQLIKNAGSTVIANMVHLAALDREGSFDSTVVLHEWGHYISNRLVQDSAGLTNTQGRGMGEGWGDFHSLIGLVKADDVLIPANANFGGVYATGGYDLGGESLPASQNNSHYYGIRRYPYSTDMSKNPLTFAHIENGVPLPVSPPPDFGADGQNNAEVHNAGEVWASALWECYAGLLNDTGRLSFDEAQTRMKSYLVGGYKMTPPAPTFLEARDAILSVVASQDMDDFAICAAGFAKRGMGVGAVAPDRNSTTNSGVVESFNAGGAAPHGSIDEIWEGFQSCDFDLIVDNGEIGDVVFSFGNTGFEDMVGAAVSFSSPQPELSFPQPNESLATVTPYGQDVMFIPVALNGAVGATEVQIDALLEHVPSSTSTVISRQFLMNVDEEFGVAATSDFEVSTLEWSTYLEGSVPEAWLRDELAIQDHRAFGPDAGAPGIVWLQSPFLQVSASENFVMTLDSRYQFEYDGTAWDGGVVEISTDGGVSWADVGAFLSPAYNGTLTDVSGNPLGNRNAYVNQNASLPNTDVITADFGTTYAGQFVMIRFGVATDAAVAGAGWEIDNVAFTGIDNTPFAIVKPEASVCGLPPEIFMDGFED